MAGWPRFRRQVPGAGLCLVLLSLPALGAGTSSTTLGFTVSVALSPKAAARLSSTKETLVVYASYAGEPRPAARRHADQIGRIDLGSERHTVASSVSIITLSGTAVRRNRLAWVDGPVLLNVNVFSGRRSSPDNLLSCDFFDGELQRAQQGPVSLHCGLITEGLPTRQVQ